MEQTFVILKPSTISRSLVGDVMMRFQRKGLIIAGIKMMQLDEAILREHYAHLADRPFFPLILESMMATPVIVMVLKGKDSVAVVRRHKLPQSRAGNYPRRLRHERPGKHSARLRQPRERRYRDSSLLHPRRNLRLRAADNVRALRSRRTVMPLFSSEHFSNINHRLDF